jgi:tetratricopeptide (TPR) repeat protein
MEEPIGRILHTAAEENLLDHEAIRGLFMQPDAEGLRDHIFSEFGRVLHKELDDVLRESTMQSFRRIQRYGSLNIELGDEQSLRKNYQNALKYYKIAWMSNPTNMTAMFGCGKMYYYTSKDKDARDFFNRMLKIEPENPQALLYLGKLEGENKRYKAAYE